MIAYLNRLIWSLARTTPQFAANQNVWARMHSRLNRDVTLQQKANRVKRRKLRGLRDGARWLKRQAKDPFDAELRPLRLPRTAGAGPSRTGR